MARSIRNLITALLPVILFGQLSGCTTPQRKISESIIVPGDCLLVMFTHDPALPCLPCVVNAKGDIHLPFDVELNVVGMTLAEVEDVIPKQYVPCTKTWRPSIFKGPN
jgi:hypothetical protein